MMTGTIDLTGENAVQVVSNAPVIAIALIAVMAVVLIAFLLLYDTQSKDSATKGSRQSA